MIRSFIFSITFIVNSLCFIPMVHAISQVKIEEGYFVEDVDGKWLKKLRIRNEFIIDHVRQNYGFELFGPRGLGQYLKSQNIPNQALDKVNKSTLASYPKPEEIEAELKSISLSYPNLVKMYSIGQSVKGRNLWVMKLTSNPNMDDKADHRPQFKYIANMHGDEIVGRELMVLLIKELVSQYGVDPEITAVLNNLQLHILVSMNPDGAALGQRANAAGVDLNRDFPDFSTSDNKNNLEGRAPETQAVMRWQSSHQFLLSANFHGGAEVVNYPWDTIEEAFPQNEYIKKLSLDYAKDAPYISASTVFENGITNGYAWYEVNGGMQDWSYYWHQDMQVTIELSNDKWPSYDRVPYYYKQNRLALRNLMKRVF